MPELPEVENFRRLLLPLVSTSSRLTLECPSETSPPRTFLSPDQVASLSGNCCVADVLRKGKLICMVLDCDKKIQNQKHVFLFIHMGMTGRISNPSDVPALESLKDKEYPPPHTHLCFRTDDAEACFSDPRKFGSVTLATSKSNFDELAPDALTPFDIDGLVGKPTGIKALLLDQKRVASGVGNWIADEVLYQSKLHPQQAHLSEEQASTLRDKLHFILETAISCLDAGEAFPRDWLFHCRWEKRAANRKGKVKDPNGSTVVFLKAAGRTSAIVPSIQVKRSQKPANSNSTKRERKAVSPAQHGDVQERSNKRVKYRRGTGHSGHEKMKGGGDTRRRSPRFAH